MRPSVCPIDRQQQRRVAGLLVSATLAGDIDRQQASAHSNNGAAARRSAANAASVVLTGAMLHIAFIVTHAYLLL